MNEEYPPVNLNSPIIQQAAKEAGLPVNEFVEMCVLQMIRVGKLGPGEFMEPGATAERLNNLRLAINLYEQFKKMTPEDQETTRGQFPDFDFPDA